MHGGHEAFHDADFVVEHLDHRRQAVGGAGRVRHDVIVGGQAGVVDPVNDGFVSAGTGGGDQHPLRAVFEMQRGLFTGGEDTGAFQRDVDIVPRQFLGVAQRGHFHRALAHIDAVAGHFHLGGEAAVHAVVAQQVGVGLDRAEIVDRHDLDIGATGFDDAAKHVAANAAEPVDGDFDGHVGSPI